MPKLAIADSRPAAAKSSPRRLCRVGIRNAAPLMNTLANDVDASAMASIDQRRAELIVRPYTVTSWHSCLKMLNRRLMMWKRGGGCLTTGGG
jgi:hypothetical protein